jgi:hypothetical protein
MREGQFFDAASLNQVKAKLTGGTLLLDTYAPYLEHRIIERADLTHAYEGAGGRAVTCVLCGRLRRQPAPHRDGRG